MVMRCMNIALALFALSISQETAAESLTQKQQDAVAAWVGMGAGDRPTADSLGLPEDMTVDEAAETLQTIWKIYRDMTFDTEVGELPLSINDLEPDAVEALSPAGDPAGPAGAHAVLELVAVETADLRVREAHHLVGTDRHTGTRVATRLDSPRELPDDDGRDGASGFQRPHSRGSRL